MAEARVRTRRRPLETDEDKKPGIHPEVLQRFEDLGLDTTEDKSPPVSDPGQAARLAAMNYPTAYVESQILQHVHRMILRGASTEAIARTFHVSSRTVDKWRRKLRTKMAAEAERVDPFEMFAEVQSHYRRVIEDSMREAAQANPHKSQDVVIDPTTGETETVRFFDRAEASYKTQMYNLSIRARRDYVAVLDRIGVFERIRQLGFERNDKSVQEASQFTNMMQAVLDPRTNLAEFMQTIGPKDEEAEDDSQPVREFL